MEASCGGRVHVFHARITGSNLPPFGVKLSICVKRCDIERARCLIKRYYQAEEVYLSFEEVDNETDNEDNM